jgi:predicted TIM-barrel fold metal-dependent hydrolase
MERSCVRSHHSGHRCCSARHLVRRRRLVAQVGPSQIMLGSDHPIPWEEHPVDHVCATESLTDEEKAGILGGNAARLFGMNG